MHKYVGELTVVWERKNATAWNSQSPPSQQNNSQNSVCSKKLDKRLEEHGGLVSQWTHVQPFRPPDEVQDPSLLIKEGQPLAENGCGISAQEALAKGLGSLESCRIWCKHKANSLLSPNPNVEMGGHQKYHAQNHSTSLRYENSRAAIAELGHGVKWFPLCFLKTKWKLMGTTQSRVRPQSVAAMLPGTPSFWTVPTQHRDF